jgi:pimeloyl-ACP methyl ester carboxylesterase
MKKNNLLILLAVLMFSAATNLFSQDGIVKSWEGTLTVGMGGHLKVVMNITKGSDGKLTATLDSPDQGAKGIPVEIVTLEGDNVKLSSASIGGTYEGKVNNSFTQIDGQWKQAGQTFPLVLKPLDKRPDEIKYFSILKGKLKTGEVELTLIVKFFKTDRDSINAVFDSPDQGSKDIPISKVYYGDDSVFCEVKVVNGFYTGKFDKDKKKVEGHWSQNGISFPLTLEKVDKIEGPKRPQTPQRPFPYNEEEVKIENKEAGLTLSGTFTYPKEGTSFPAVILVTGSGPQNRDEELLGHKPFLVWSDYLTRNGIAVLRYDDRGIAKSRGNFSSATTFDFADDAIAAVKYLRTRKEVQKGKIGIAGHSEGGLIAPLAANRCSDVNFIILAGGPAVPGDEIVLLQSELIARKSGIPEDKIKEEYESNKKAFDAIKSAKDSLQASERLDNLFNGMYNNLPASEKSKPEYSKENFAQMKKAFLSKWFINFIKYDPRTELVKLNIPVLAMFGENDLQVPPSQNKGEMEKALKKDKSKCKVVVLPGLNHVFQECKTGSPSEYGQIEQTASPKMLELMTGWIKDTAK